MNQGPSSPEVLQRSQHLSTFAHQGAVYLYHDLYGYLLQMSPDLIAFLGEFAGPTKVADVVARHADAFEGQAPQQFVDVFYQHACLVEPDDVELEGLWPMIAIKGKWNVWQREGDRVTLWTAWGDHPVRQVALDADETRMWDDFDGEKRLNELRAVHDRAKLQALVVRLAHSDVQAVKLCAFPLSMFAKRPQMAPRYLASTMPYRRWQLGEALEAPVTDVATDDYYRDGVKDAAAQFDHRETTLSHLFREPHPALHGQTYGAALVEGLARDNRLPTRRIRVLEIGAGLGYVARAVCEALQARGLEVTYTIQEIAPALAAAQRTRCAGLPVTVLEGDVLKAELATDGYDLILANEMVGDLPAVQLSRADVGLAADGSGGEVESALLATLGRPGELVTELGIVLDDAPEPFYLLIGALELMIKIAGWLAPDGTAVVTEFGDRMTWPKLSTHLDHPELSTHFGHLLQAAKTKGLDGRIDFVMDLIDLQRDTEGLATTRSHFRALRALAAAAGVDLPKLGYTRDLLAARCLDKLDLTQVGELRWDKIEDRLMGLVPHEFKALVVRKPDGN